MVQISRRNLLLGAGAGAFALVLGGCGDDDDASPTESNRDGAMDGFGVGTQFTATKPLTFDILYSNHSFYPMKKEWLFWSELTKRTNVTLNPTVVPASDYEQKRSLLIGAGDAPPIIPKTYAPAEEPFVASGAILPVSDYLDLMPNFKDKVAKWNMKADLDTRRQADGKFYLLPGLHEDVWIDYSIAVRTDILTELGLQTPTTWDEVYAMLKAMKAKYPDKYPWSERWNFNPRAGGALLRIVGETYALNLGWNYQSTSWDYDAKKFVFTGTADRYRDLLTFLNKLVAEGLLDPESFTQDDDAARQKLASGKSFVISSNAQTLVNDYRPDLAQKLPKATIIKIPLPIGPSGSVKLGTRLENGIMIAAKAKDRKDFVAMMQFIDWLWYSDEGQLFAKWGVDGTTYTKDATGAIKIGADVDYVGLNPTATKHLQKDFGFGNGVFAYGGTTKLLQSTFSAEELDFQHVMDGRKTLEVPPPAPLTSEEREQATLWETPLRDYVEQMGLKFILGQRSLSEWDAYVNEVKGKNSERYMELVTKAAERFQKEHG